MRPVKGFPNYFVSSTGVVWSQKKKLFLRPCVDSGGYLIVTLCINRKHKTCLIHRLVLETYVGPCPEGKECRHLDGDQLNNQLDNLCWGTHKDNIQDAIHHGTWYSKGRCGEKALAAKLSNRERRLIIYQYSTGLFTLEELATEYKVVQTTVWNLISGTRWPFVDVRKIKDKL